MSSAHARARALPLLLLLLQLALLLSCVRTSSAATLDAVTVAPTCVVIGAPACSDAGAHVSLRFAGDTTLNSTHGALVTVAILFPVEYTVVASPVVASATFDGIAIALANVTASAVAQTITVSLVVPAGAAASGNLSLVAVAIAFSASATLPSTVPTVYGTFDVSVTDAHNATSDTGTAAASTLFAYANETCLFASTATGASSAINVSFVNPRASPQAIVLTFGSHFSLAPNPVVYIASVAVYGSAQANGAIRITNFGGVTVRVWRLRCVCPRRC